MKKIGLYTIHAANNYGAMLQAYATIKTLTSQGFNAEIFNYYPLDYEQKKEYKILNRSLKGFLNFIYCKFSNKIKQRFSRFNEFHNEMNLSDRVFSLDEVYANPPKYDVNIVGSDQVWNLQKGFAERNFFFLDFLSLNSRKMSYASSFGTKSIDEKHSEKLKNLLEKFDTLSVREDDGVQIIKESTGIDAKHVLDPTFLLNADEWRGVGGEEPLIKESYILYYGFSSSKETAEIVKSFSEKLNLPVISVSGGIHFPFKVKRFYLEAGPKEFINLVENAKLVLTGSFHGLAFAINFSKDFYLVENSTRSSRMLSALRVFDLEDRVILTKDEVKNIDRSKIVIDYKKISLILETKRNESKDWLKESVLNLLK